MAARTGLTRREVVLNGKTVVYYEGGTGPTLVFFHGGGTWEGIDFAADWAKRFHVVFPYHPGWGESEDNPAIVGMGDYVLHYLDFLDALKIDRFRLVGLSFGGWMAAEFAVSHSHRIEKLALVGAGGLVGPGAPPPDPERLNPKRFHETMVVNSAVLEPFLPKGEDPDWYAARAREGGSAGKVFMAQAQGRSIANWLHRVTVPTLVVWGEDDQIVSAKAAPLWMAGLPNATLKLMPRVGHLVLTESPEAVKLVADFMA